MGGFVSIPEIALLLLVILLVFGPRRVPEIGRQLGKGMREFKQSITGDEGEATDTDEAPSDERAQT
jgi:sec-independent protein translocase protein TatA